MRAHASRLLGLTVVLSVGACGDDAPAIVGDASRFDGGASEAGPDGGRSPDADERPCTRAADCDDGVYCNGVEQCSPASPGADVRGCLEAASPCLEGQPCDEAVDRCTTSCASPDADGDGHDAANCGGDDCDDADANRNPSRTETCDAADRDEDCDSATFGFRDADMDDEGDALCCNGTTCGRDCDDNRPSVNSGAGEACNSRDDDCDGSTDEGVVVTLFRDADGDGFGVATDVRMGCADAVPGYVELGTDCDDTSGAVHPGAADTCDTAGLDEDCSGTPNDPPRGCACTGTQDRPCTAGGVCGMGRELCIAGEWSACSILPGPEVCDGDDDDCNNVVDDDLRQSCWPDGDGDGYAVAAAMPMELCATPGNGCPSGYTPRSPVMEADCDDGSSARSPAGTERCNGLNDDCDAATDEGLTVVCYADQDNDTYAPGGAPASNRCPDVDRPSVGSCPINTTNRPPTAGVTTDCNDAAGTGFPIHPGAPELCDMIDNDCDGAEDDGARVPCYADADDDGYAAAAAPGSMQCQEADRATRGYCPRFFTNRSPAALADQDCAATDPSRYPNAIEICDAIDQDCDGLATDVMMVACYADPDGDTYTAPGTSAVSSCPDASRGTVGNCPTGTTNRAPTSGATDCAPTDPTRHPGVTELCDSMFVDQNCNGAADEGSVTCYRDMDDDGYALGGAMSTMTCVEPTRAGEPHLGCPFQTTGRAPSSTAARDCNDNAPASHVIVSCYTDADGDGYRATNPSAPVERCFVSGGGVGGCPSGQTTSALEDCCDADANAKPGQTAYFGAARVGCGGFDYNCSGVHEPDRTTLAGNHCNVNWTVCEARVIDPHGWSLGVPACGDYGEWVTDCYVVTEVDPEPPMTTIRYCENEADFVQQRCR